MASLVRRLLENSSNQAWFHAGRGHAAPVSAPKPKAEVVPAPVDSGFRNAGPARFFDPDVRRRMVEALAGMRGSFGGAYPLLIGERRVSDRPQAEGHCPGEPETVVGPVAQASPAHA